MVSIACYFTVFCLFFFLYLTLVSTQHGVVKSIAWIETHSLKSQCSVVFSYIQSVKLRLWAGSRLIPKYAKLRKGEASSRKFYRMSCLKELRSSLVPQWAGTQLVNIKYLWKQSQCSPFPISVFTLHYLTFLHKQLCFLSVFVSHPVLARNSLLPS